MIQESYVIEILGKADGYAVHLPPDDADAHALAEGFDRFAAEFAEELEIVMANVDGEAPDIFKTDGEDCGTFQWTGSSGAPLRIILLRVGPYPEQAIFLVDHAGRVATLVGIVNPRGGQACDAARQRVARLRRLP